METHNQTAFAHILTLSGILGIAAAMAVVTYQMALQDPVIFGGRSVPPAWTTTVFTTLLGGSIITIVYSTLIDEVLRGWFDIVTITAIIGQWGIPVGLYLSRDAGSNSLLGFSVILSSVLAVLTALAIFGNYARRCWPKIPNPIPSIIARLSRS